MANWYSSSAQYTAVAQWAASHTYSAGAIVRQLTAPAMGSERCFRTAAGGTSGGTEPAWTLTKGSTSPADGTVTWVEVTGNSAYNWTAAHATLFGAAAWMAAGDTLFVGDDNAESWAAAVVITFPGTGSAPSLIYCVDHTQASPGTGDFKTTGAVSTTGNSALSFGGIFYIYGLTLTCGSGAFLPIFSTSLVAGCTWDTCKFILGGTGTGQQLRGSAPGTVWKNCTVKFSSVWSSIVTTVGTLLWRGGSFDGTGSIPNNLEAPGNGFVTVENVDLSAATGVLVQNSGTQCMASFKDCHVSSSALMATVTSNTGTTIADFIRCDSGGITYRNERWRTAGTLTTETQAIRTGGASDGTTGYSWKIVSNSTSFWSWPFEAFPMAIWNNTLATNRNVTVEGIASPISFAALPNNDEVWFDVEYMGSASSPLGSIQTGSKANNLATGSALTASTQAWDSVAPARANSTAYTVGKVIKTASNAGRLFFCTTAGTSTTSEPGGFATAVDGGSITDGTATFKAGWRFKQTVTLSAPQPAMIGPITVYAKVGKASATVYVDPLITLS